MLVRCVCNKQSRGLHQVGIKCNVGSAEKNSSVTVNCTGVTTIRERGSRAAGTSATWVEHVETNKVELLRLCSHIGRCREQASLGKFNEVIVQQQKRKCSSYKYKK